jgi:large subunit ribosomal protein L32e
LTVFTFIKRSEGPVTEDKKRLMKIRSNIKKKRPHFKRFESWRLVRIKDQWRKPRGIDNKMRTELKGWPKSVKPGYRGPTHVRGLHPSGLSEVMVWNASDLDKINPENQVARVGGTVGGRKREAIKERADELNIRVLNIVSEKEASAFEELEDEEEEGEDEE